MRKVMVFGVFDGVHEGHRHFFRQARELGDYLIAVVAQDHVVAHLKGHLPAIPLAERFEHLQEEDSVDEVAIGDMELSAYDVVKKHKPDTVAFGYDQLLLKEDFEKHRDEFDWPVELRMMQAYEPNIYHSSLLSKKQEE